tara:strand:- start:837 stop:1445 length:609 start_codon:yes stop_codon:yes gene_type:complete
LLENVSIIIPVAPNEPALETLLQDLKYCRNEIITSSEGTRAKSLNAGAAKATKDFLWFLHADSRVSAENIIEIAQATRIKTHNIHYFKLAFEGRGLPTLNAWGANMRSRLFGTPFGDQGYCLSKRNFHKIGGYPEDVPYGEDLMFIWRARQAGIRLNALSSSLRTSPRKYMVHGWGKLTLLYQWRWISMSLPEIAKLMRGKK